MSERNWKRNEISYLKRYAASKTLDELAQRFDTDTAAVSAELKELGLSAKGGLAGADPLARDPDVKAFEKGVEALYAKKWAQAKKIFDKLAAESDLPELAGRARQFSGVCGRRMDESPGAEEGDPFLRAVYLKNRGDLAAALKACKGDGREKDDRFVFLAASIHALEERLDEAAEALGKAIELNPENRVHAYHDSDFAELRKEGDYAQIFGLG